MRAVVTGGAGFLGSHLCDRLLAEGWDVLALDNLITGDARNLSHLKENKRFELVEKNVNEPLQVEGEVAYVFHFASPASPPDYLKFPIETLKVGSLGTMHTLDLALEKKAKFFLASTRECYECSWRCSRHHSATAVRPRRRRFFIVFVFTMNFPLRLRAVCA